MGIIDSLSAGFRLLGQHLYLMALPIALDLALLFLPGLSVAPIYQTVAAWYAQTSQVEGLPAEMAEMTTQVSDLLNIVGSRSNLWGLLANGSLLHVPSLMGAVGLVPGMRIGGQITDPVTAGSVALLLSLLSVVIGVAYLMLLARQLPIGNGPKQPGLGTFLRSVLRQSVKVVLFALTMALMLLVIYVPLIAGLALISLISPSAGSMVAFLLGGLVLMLFFYLYFAVPALILDNQSVRTAVLQSIRLTRSSFFPTLGFVILTNVISLGLGLIFGRFTAFAPLGMPVGMVAAIVGTAYIGTGLALALLIFYRTRLLRLAEELALYNRRQ